MFVWLMWDISDGRRTTAVLTDFQNSKSMPIASQNALSKTSWPKMPFQKSGNRVSHVEKQLFSHKNYS
jgi:hypothetical protein